MREGQQTVKNEDDYNDASAMAAPGTHQLSAGQERVALHGFRPHYAQASSQRTCAC